MYSLHIVRAINFQQIKIIFMLQYNTQVIFCQFILTLFRILF